MNKKVIFIKRQIDPNSIQVKVWPELVGTCCHIPYYLNRTVQPRQTYFARNKWIRQHTIPEGMHLCHKCDMSICFNIEHLFIGTRSDNMKDMMKKGRHRIFNNGRHNLSGNNKSYLLKQYLFLFMATYNVLNDIL